MEQAMIMGDDQRLIQLMIVNKYQFTEITAMLELLHEIKKQELMVISSCQC